MTNKILTFAVTIGIIVTSCNELPKKTNTENTTKIIKNNISDEIVKHTSTDKEGEKLEMIFNNTKNIVTLNFNGETIELAGQNPASGMWYKNENYELIGKGKDVELTKNGKIIFEHKSNDSNSEDKNNKQTQKTDVLAWWVGKSFENNRPLSQNPEEGGVDFLVINQDQTASYKVGDIVDEMTWKADATTIIFKNKITEREIIFKISNSFLTDSYGTKWTVRK